MGTFIGSFDAMSEFSVLSEVSTLCVQHAGSLKCVALTPQPACCLLQVAFVASAMNDSTDLQLQNKLKPLFFYAEQFNVHAPYLT